MKITLEVEVPKGTTVAEIEGAVKRAFDPDWMAEWWHTDDVIYQAKDNGEELTEQEARDVLAMVNRKHDCNIGINWDVIDYWIDEIVKEREEV